VTRGDGVLNENERTASRRSTGARVKRKVPASRSDVVQAPRRQMWDEGTTGNPASSSSSPNIAKLERRLVGVTRGRSPAPGARRRSGGSPARPPRGNGPRLGGLRPARAQRVDHASTPRRPPNEPRRTAPFGDAFGASTDRNKCGRTDHQGCYKEGTLVTNTGSPSGPVDVPCSERS